MSPVKCFLNAFNISYPPSLKKHAAIIQQNCVSSVKEVLKTKLYAKRICAV